MCTTCSALVARGADGESDNVGTRRPTLTPRELQVAVAWVLHDTKEQVAKDLYLSASTVKTNIQRTRQKYAALGRPAGTQVMLLIRLVQDGVIDFAVLRDLDHVRTVGPDSPGPTRGREAREDAWGW